MADNQKNDLFHRDEFGEQITPKENIIDYIEFTHFVQINDKENREILQSYGLDKNGSLTQYKTIIVIPSPKKTPYKN